MTLPIEGKTLSPFRIRINLSNFSTESRKMHPDAVDCPDDRSLKIQHRFAQIGRVLRRVPSCGLETTCPGRILPGQPVKRRPNSDHQFAVFPE